MACADLIYGDVFFEVYMQRIDAHPTFTITPVNLQPQPLPDNEAYSGGVNNNGRCFLFPTYLEDIDSIVTCLRHNKVYDLDDYCIKWNGNKLRIGDGGNTVELGEFLDKNDICDRLEEMLTLVRLQL